LYALGKTLQTMVDGNFHVQVGIFGDKAMRDPDASGGAYSEHKPKKSHLKPAQPGEMTNAELGFIHEMGSKTRGIPRRSFLWDTLRDCGSVLMEMLAKVTAELFHPGMAAISAGGEGAVVGEHKVMQYLKKAGRAAEHLVQLAFQTGGFGRWAPDKSMSRKHTKLILVETHQLRQAIASRVSAA
jgi:hypothetical protein